MSPTRLATDGLRARVAGVWTQEKLMYLRKYAEAFMIAMAPKPASKGAWVQACRAVPLMKELAFERVE